MMKFSIPRLIIAGTHSGVGKTTVALAVMAALTRRGLQVQPFKVGPDYLDPLHHTRATGRPCRNLDGWMLSRDYVIRAFAGACAGAQVAVIEGMMGLFDGKEPASEEASTAQMAKWLAAPVVLVVDAGGMARSLGALLQGFARFDPDVALAGAVFNRVASREHLQWLGEVARPYLPSFGGLPADPTIEMPERHLGLTPPTEDRAPDQVLDRLAAIAEEHLAIDALLAVAQSAPPLAIEVQRPAHASPRCRIAVGRDEAFHFYYADNLDLLERAGAELVFFSPVHDHTPPPAVHGIYLGGGYPEVYAPALSANTAMRDAIARFAHAGGPLYAECGGLMYLARAILTTTGEHFAMTGILPGSIQMQERLAALGYREVEATVDTPLLRRGERARGHEFRYSGWAHEPVEDDAVQRVYRVVERGRDAAEGYRYKNVLASYIHLHFGSAPGIAERFVQRCAGWTPHG